jgi:hypothetical protein
MMRKSHLAIAIVLLITLATPVQAATPKAGAKCTKAGATATAAGKKFTCIKSGTRLVWNKGVAIKAAPKPSLNPAIKPVEPTPTASPTSTPTPTPSPTPTIPPAPIVFSFDNIASNYLEISANVYNKYEKFIDPNHQSKLKVNVLVGPNTKPLNTNPAPAYAIASNLFRNFSQPDEVHAIYYSFLDKEWAKSKTQEKDGTPRWNYQFEYECLSLTDCRGASAGMTQNWQAIGRMTANTATSPLVLRMFSSGETEIHEYAHSVYMFQMKPNFNRWYISTPSWFSEGHATALGKLGGAMSFREYVSDQQLTYRSAQPNQSLRSVSLADILRFYDAFSDGKEDPSMKSYVYSLGYSTVEALIAIGGIDSPMNLFVQTAKGMTFEQAFKAVYGIEWKVAAPILAEVVSKQYRAFYP